MIELPECSRCGCTCVPLITIRIAEHVRVYCSVDCYIWDYTAISSILKRT